MDMGTLFLGPVGIFCWTCMYCVGPGEFFFGQPNELFLNSVSFFLDPCACFVDLASMGWGGNPLVIGAQYIGLGVFGPWRLLFLNRYIFSSTWHRVGGI